MQAMAQSMATMQATMEMMAKAIQTMNAPRKIIRDKQGRADMAVPVTMSS